MKILLWSAIILLTNLASYYLGIFLGIRQAQARYLKLAYSTKACVVCDQQSRYASYTYKAHKFLVRVPWVGRWAISAMVGVWYQQILKRGMIYARTRNI